MNPDKLPPKMADKIIEAMIKSGALSFLQIDGTSMEPFFRNRTRVLVDHRIKSFSPGDTVLFETESGSFIHRVIKAEGDSFVTKGDSRLTTDEPVAAGMIRGVVTAFQDGEGRLIYINKEPYLSFGRMMAELSLKSAVGFAQMMEESTGELEKAGELHSRAYGLYREGGREEALNLFQKALAYNPKSLLSRVDAGEILRQLGRFREALFHLKAALELDGRTTDISAQAYNIAGNTYVDMGMFEESLEEYDSCISIAPDFAPAYVNRGWAYYRTGRTEQAEKDFESVLKLQPENFKALKCLGLLYLTSGRYDNAVDVLRKALDIEPDDPDVLNNLGLSYLKRGPLKKAGDCFRMALVASPDHFDTLFNLGRFIEKASSSAEAMAHYVKLNEKFPNRMEIKKEIARLGALG